MLKWIVLQVWVKKVNVVAQGISSDIAKLQINESA